MTLIKCPHCGHSVLSVASRCATCNRELGPNFLGPEHVGELAECRSCGNPVRSASRFCPKCGATSPAKRSRVARPVLSLTAIFLLGVLVVDRWPKPGPKESAISEVTSSPAQEPPVHETAVNLVTAPESIAAVVTSPAPAPADSAPVVQHKPVDTVTRAPAPSEPVAREVRPAEPASAPAPVAVRQTRWTRLWVNVRQQPVEDAPVVRVLRPGTRIEGQERRWGWWVVYVDGDSTGYVAGNLLSARQPTIISKQ